MGLASTASDVENRPGCAKACACLGKKAVAARVFLLFARLELRGHAGPVWDVTVLPDGRHPTALWFSGVWFRVVAFHFEVRWGRGRAVTCSQDATAKVWDLATGACARTLQGHNDGVTAVAVLPDGRPITASQDSSDGR